MKNSLSSDIVEEFFECHRDEESFYEFHKFDAIVKTEEVDRRKEIGAINHILMTSRNLLEILLKILLFLVPISVLLQPLSNKYICREALKEANSVNVDEPPNFYYKSKDVLDPNIYNSGLLKMEVKDD